jgi:flagellar biosynthetic protein FlhB
MAEEQQDKDQRTEDPTDKRTEEARREGKLPVSQEVRTWFMLVAGLIVIAGPAHTLGQDMMESLPKFFGMADQLRASDGGLRAALLDTMHHIMPGLALAGAILMAAAIIGSVVQTGFYSSPELLSPKWERLSWIAGVRKLFSVQSLVDTLKGFIKIGIVAILMYKILWPLVHDAEWFVGMGAALQMDVTYKIILQLIGVAVIFISFYAAADWGYQYYTYKESLKMTKQEVKDESKQSEGDPVARSRIRRIRMERSRRRMMAQVPDADVIITNPTHYAVALEYKPEKMRAPKVIAKGQDVIALKIREIADEHLIPIVENPPLARALHASCELDDEVPVEHYQAVAEVISYVYKIKKRTIKRADS